jgi:hypothetical protein
MKCLVYVALYLSLFPEAAECPYGFPRIMLRHAIQAVASDKSYMVDNAESL